jgi:tetratricopeptide (TPR) repeat protein/transcriptional regulator with XRE-family HTH domain
VPLVALGGRLNEDDVLAAGSFGVLLRRYRLASGLSQEELAQRAGLSVRALANMERGRTKRPYKRSVRLLADALALSEVQHLDLDRASRLVACDAAIPSLAAARETIPGAGLPAAAHPTQPATDLARPSAERVTPRELPAPVGHFSGREAELDQLSEMAASSCGRALVICAVGGTGGVGKTALAVQWAHRVADRFPDGQLYVNLRGYDPDQPVAPTDALAGLLRTLGVPGTDVPDGAQDRARLYRSRLAGRRMLVLLDNARDGEQVRPLLPGDPGCVTVVTSRDTLAGLVATDGARRLDLDVLPLADAVGLLRSLIGPRAEQDPAAAAELAGLCARLPLALRIAAELAAARREVTLRDLAAELAASQLDLLNAGEDRADLRAVFSWSYRQLDDGAAEAFALAGLHPGPELDAHAAAALTGTSAELAGRVLGRLYRVSLVQAASTGRYCMHDLLRAYACEQAAERDTEGRCQQALTRLFDYYLTAAGAAMDVLYPAEAHHRPRIARAAAVVPSMAGEADALAWLDRERSNLVAVVAHCAQHGWLRHATGLAGTLFRYLMTGSHLPEVLTINRHALLAARQSSDPAAEASALNALGGMDFMRGRYRDAADRFRSALELYRRCGDRVGEARILHNLGISEHHLHNHQSAADYCRSALSAYEDAEDSLGAARALTDLAAAETDLGCYTQAADHLERALPILRDARDHVREAIALGRIGELNVLRGQLTLAADCFEQALALSRRVDHRTGIADQLLNLGEVSLHQGKYQQAIGRLRQATALYREIGQQGGETVALRTLAEALQADGQPAAARAELETASRLAAETGNTYLQASAHRELAENYDVSGEDKQALYHWQRALTLYTELGAPEADQVRSRLGFHEAEQPAPRVSRATA